MLVRSIVPAHSANDTRITILIKINEDTIHGMLDVTYHKIVCGFCCFSPDDLAYR